MIEQLKAEGSARSRGTGRSAAKNIQGAMMMAGMQQSQIVENIADSKQQFKIASTSINTSMMNDINNAELQTGQLDNSIMYKQQEYNQNLRELKAYLDLHHAFSFLFIVIGFIILTGLSFCCCAVIIIITLSWSCVFIIGAWIIKMCDNFQTLYRYN